MSFHFIVHFQPRPGMAAGFRQEFLRRVNQPSRDEASCLRIDVFESVRDPAEFAVHSEWVDYLQPKREASRATAVRQFETPPGRQAQVDWGHLGTLEMNGEQRKLSGFTLTLGYSRILVAEAALDQKLGTLLRMHEHAFHELGGVPEEILYDRMKTVWIDLDDRGEVVWHPMFLDFAHYWGFTPRLCRPYRAQTKGKVESGVKYVRRNFLCGLLGNEPCSLEEFNGELRRWVGAHGRQSTRARHHA